MKPNTQDCVRVPLRPCGFRKTGQALAGSLAPRLVGSPLHVHLLRANIRASPRFLASSNDTFGHHSSDFASQSDLRSVDMTVFVIRLSPAAGSVCNLLSQRASHSAERTHLPRRTPKLYHPHPSRVNCPRPFEIPRAAINASHLSGLFLKIGRFPSFSLCYTKVL